MERTLYRKLLDWKEAPDRQPLVLHGARQVGKTWLLKEFGRTQFESCVYVNCDREPFASTLFADYDLGRILLAIEARKGVPVRPGRTLLVLDEIQEAPRGLGALKYFCEDMPQLHVAAAGSLLGITLHAGTSYPVGKVDEMTLRPLSFPEFLRGTGETGLADAVESGDPAVLDSLRADLTERLRRYFFVGGMPAPALAFAEGRGLEAVRSRQRAILSHYLQDISKHAPERESPRIHQVWQSIVPQLSRESKRFVYGAVKPGGRAKEFELAIQWLVDAGIVHRVPRVTKPGLPLSFHEDFGAFKLYPLDVGLMGALANAPAGAILDGDAGFTEFKGAFAEAYILAELLSGGERSPFYFSSSDSEVEIDFLVQRGAEVVPIEVKAGENLRSKSLRTFVERHAGLKGVRFSLSPHRDQGWMENIPLYAANAWARDAAKRDFAAASKKECLPSFRQSTTKEKQP